MKKSKLLQYGWITSLILLIAGLLPYRSSIFISKDSYLLVTPQVCGCPCADVRIKKGTISIPEYLSKEHSNVPAHEANLINSKVIDNQSMHGNYYDYYIHGKVVDVDTILCDINDCEIAPVISVEDCYLAEYVPLFLAANNILILCIYILNLLIVLPAATISIVINWSIERKRKK